MKLIWESLLIIITYSFFPIISQSLQTRISVNQKHLKPSLSFSNNKDQNWNANLSQEGFMLNDRCILVNENDEIIGSSNKLEAHVFDDENPDGLLHRAFSVFLFNTKGELLLQQRAAHKKTFPDVWTNTCCSHPLHDMSPTEIDSPQDIAGGKVPGTCNAILRKLKQELGIGINDDIDVANQLSIEDFKFLTRIHYCAKDISTHFSPMPLLTNNAILPHPTVSSTTTAKSMYLPDKNMNVSPSSAYYGEHEIDYILFVKKDVCCAPNPDEVQATRYVTLIQLQQMLQDPSLKWSPWFRIIAEKFLVNWWADLEHTLTMDSTFNDFQTIHKF